MKKTIKTVLFLAIAALGFVNLKIDGDVSAKSCLSLVENYASADSEAETGLKYYVKSVDAVTVTNTIVTPKGYCTISYNKTTTTCTGAGTISCTPGEVRGPSTSTC